MGDGSDTKTATRTRGVRELTLESALSRLRETDHDFRGPVEHEGGDHSLYFEDPEGNVVELWDFVKDGEGAENGIHAFWRARLNGARRRPSGRAGPGA